MPATAEVYLLSLPTEVLGFIIPDPALLHGITVGQTEGSHWHALEFVGDRTIDLQRKSVIAKSRSTLVTLRALSHTCQRLRALTLPLLWRVVHLKTVEELGKLRDQLRIVPSIAKYIRHFEYLWSLKDDCDSWPKELGATRLDLAFIDRGKAWDLMQSTWSCEVVDSAFFEHRGVEYYQPGVPVPTERLEAPEELEDFEELEGYEIMPIIPNVARSGPDGHGTDLRIQSPNELNDALDEIVAQLTSLEAFRWHCTSTPMPAGVFNALKKLPNLGLLNIYMSFKRNEVRLLPYWELASNLTTLSIFDGQCSDWTPDGFKVRVEPVTEEALTSFELPHTFVGRADDELDDLMASVMCRTIVTAAIGGRLKHLELLPRSSGKYEKAFAIRALLPVWIGIEHWHFAHNHGPSPKSWIYAAWRLRISLAHLSNLGYQQVIPDRRLGPADVQAMYYYFKKKALPVVLMPWLMAMEPIEEHGPFDTYLLWLRDDAKLCQQVADAWNEVVNRGQEDVYRCYCETCDPELPEA